MNKLIFISFLCSLVVSCSLVLVKLLTYRIAKHRIFGWLAILGYPGPVLPYIPTLLCFCALPLDGKFVLNTTATKTL